MLDRESTFAHPEIVALLKSRFVPVAIDQAYQRRQQDTEGEFYRKITSQSPRNDFDSTTQGFYVVTAGGELLLFNNNRDPEKLLRLIRESLDDFASRESTEHVDALKEESVDKRFRPSKPKDGLVLRVHAKILDGYEPTTNKWKSIFQNAMSRDNLWITAAEHRAIVDGTIPRSLQTRIARFHLVDNTRGEPPMWKSDEIRSLEMKLNDRRVLGKVQLATADGARGYESTLRGEIEVHDGKVTRFDMVCLGLFWGEGRYTRGAPEGKFPLAISFTLADGQDNADDIPPQGSRGWLDGYLQAER